MNIKKILKYYNLIWSYIFSKNIKIKTLLRITNQKIIINNRNKIEIGENTFFGNYLSLGYFSSSFVSVRESSKGIFIGEGCKFGNQVSLISSAEIRIFDNCLIGNNVKIYDSDFHSLKLDRSYKNAKSKAIIISENVFIGDNTIVLKGAVLGKNSVIGAGSIVTGNIEENSIYAGNPARKVGYVDKF